MWTLQTVLVLSAEEQRQSVSEVNASDNPSGEECYGQILVLREHQNITHLSSTTEIQFNL